MTEKCCSVELGLITRFLLEYPFSCLITMAKLLTAAPSSFWYFPLLQAMYDVLWDQLISNGWLLTAAPSSFWYFPLLQAMYDVLWDQLISNGWCQNQVFQRELSKEEQETGPFPHLITTLLFFCENSCCSPMFLSS